MCRLLAFVSADAGGVRRFLSDFAFDRGQRAKVEPARVFALVIAVEHGERDAIGPSPIAVPQRDDAGPRRRFEHQRGTIARNRARMAFEPEAVIGKAPPAETKHTIAGGLTQGAAHGKTGK